jgi:hypothetical protein
MSKPGIAGLVASSGFVGSVLLKAAGADQLISGRISG